MARVSKPTFSIKAGDLERGPRSLKWVVPQAWLAQALAEAGATPIGDGTLEAEFSKNGKEVLVRGRAHAQVTVPCVVTLDPLPFTLESEIFLMLSPAPVPRQPKATADGTPKKAEKTKENPKAASGRRSSVWSLDPELSSKDAAKDTFDGETVALDNFLREFLVLELPMFPRRSDLPSGESPAIAPPSVEDPQAPPAIDPRLMPLAAIANRLREQKKE